LRAPPRGRLTGALVLLLLAACAKVAPPPGGAEDLEPPQIVTDGVQPPPGAAGVDPQRPVVIVFSERPDQRSVMRALRIWPRVDFREVEWQADTLRLVPDPAWSTERRTVLRISRRAEDRRGNTLAAAFLLDFTTRAAADSGGIAGTVWAGRERERNQPVVVLAFAAGDSADPAVSDPYAIADAGPDGRFRLGGLDTARAWRVAALLDRNEDFEADGRGEALAVVPDTVRFADGESTATVPDFLVGTIDSVGKISGEIAADSGAVVFVQARGAGADSAAALRPEWRSRALRDGQRFELELPTGALYTAFAFVDADGDSLPGEGERRQTRDEVLSLRFVTSVSGLRFDLRSEPSEESLELLPATADSAGVGPPGGTAAPDAPEGAGEEGERP